jgi:hypothetical protein
VTSRSLAAWLAGCLCALAACGGGGADEASGAVAPPTTAPVETTVGASDPVAPLTGEVLLDDERRERPAVVVKVDDSPRALGRQEGLAEADLVYVERVEGGALRLAAVYHSTDVTTGPVRSARTSDLGLTANLNRPLFAYSGANGGVLRMVRDADLVDLGYDAVPDHYAERGTGVLRFFVDTADLRDLAPDGGGPPPQQLVYREPGAPVANAGAEDVASVTIRYPGTPGTEVAYRDEGDGWARLQGGEPHLLDGGGRVSPENLIVQFIEYRGSGFVDVNGAESPEAVVTGEGDAWVFTGGALVRARWSRTELGGPTAYTDSAGDPVLLEPGRTWVELAEAGTASTT